MEKEYVVIGLGRFGGSIVRVKRFRYGCYGY